VNLDRNASKLRATRLVVVDAKVRQDGWVGVDLDALRAAQAAHRPTADATPVGASWDWQAHALAPAAEAMGAPNVVRLRAPASDPLRRRLRRIPAADIVMVGREPVRTPAPAQKPNPWRPGSPRRLALLSLILGLTLVNLVHSRGLFGKPYAVEIPETVNPRAMIT
jgi:hypothetical protein